MSLFRLFGYSLEEAVISLWQNQLINLIAITTIAISLFIDQAYQAAIAELG